MIDLNALSHWGWGRADRFPDRDARAQTAQLVAAMLGFPGLQLEDPVPIEAATLPAPRFTPPSPLSHLFDTSPRCRAQHTWGRAYPDLLRGLRGDFSAAPDAVAFPRDAADVARLLDWASEGRVAAIPFGGGTSVTGGVEARLDGDFTGVVSIDLRAMDRVLDVDPLSLTARIQAGASGPLLEDQLNAHGLTLRHFPQSFELSTLGGWIATRAGGHFATVYTHIDDLVASIEAVSPAGLLQTRALPASGAGPDPNRLLLGSEGALGVITEATVRVRPRPGFRAQADLLFPDLASALRATRAIAQSRLHPANCRLLDAREAALHQVVHDGSHVLILAFESAHNPVEHALQAAIDLARPHNARLARPPKISAPSDEKSQDRSAANAWRDAFINAPYLLNTLVASGLLVETFETACTWSAFDALHADVIRSVREAMKRACGAGHITCRFTHVYPDGPAPYYTLIAPARRGDEIAQWADIKAAAGDTLARHGATITHHHAVGRFHKRWYAQEVPDLFLQTLRAAKHTLDPAGILNPGVLLP